MMDQDLLVSIVGGWVVWALTYITRVLIPEGEFKTAVRHWTPEIASVLAVAIVGAWQVLDGADVWSGETLRRALSAAAAAVFGHSLVVEKIKMMKKDKGDPPAQKNSLTKVSMVFCCVVFMGGCSNSPQAITEYFPEVKISNTDGCPDVSIRQPLPSPEGWSVITETRIQKKCPPEQAPPQSPNPE